MAPAWPAAAVTSDLTLLLGYLAQISPAELNAEAERYGEPHAAVPAVPLLRGEEVVGWALLTSDYVSTTGYSGKPIHIVMALDNDAVITGVRLVEHAEPIVLVGIPDAEIQALTESYAGLDLKAEAAAGGSAHDLEIISGATVTIIVIDDSVVRAGLKAARRLGLGGLAPPRVAEAFEIDPDVRDPRDWATLAGEGAVATLRLDVGQVTQAFQAQGDVAAAARPESGDASDIFIDLNTALVSTPAIGQSLLGEAEHQNLERALGEGEHAILVAGRGHYSFKGSGYVRGGVFDRIHLVQGDISVRFRDRQHQRMGQVAAVGAPTFTEVDLFTIPADSGFDPAQPWRLQLLAQRAIGPVEKAFLTFDLPYALPQSYLRRVGAPADAPAIAGATDPADEAAAKAALWQRIWRDRKIEIGVLVAALGVLTTFFFFQMPLTRSESAVFWFRIGFLTFTTVWIGWIANAQLSVVNVLALGNALATDFSWDAFLIDPLIFILWFAVAASLLFWGRGAYCGWLCPFGALQELLNRLAKLVRIPQVALPWGLHERLWPIKYILFLGLFGLSLYSLPLAEQYAEVEPFKTAIILKFQRAWPFVLFAGALLVAGLFIERFYCRYLCPLGAALAIPAKLRIFEWMKRYRECGAPCHRCANECMVQAIHPDGRIDTNECLYCMHCQVLYQHGQKCPVCIKRMQRRAPFIAQAKAEARTQTEAGATASS